MANDRTTEHCERWSVCRFLATFADATFLRFPLTIVHRDRPDFLLNMGNHKIGIEVTEAIPEDEARASALAQHREYNELSFIERYVSGEGRRSLKQIDAIARGNASKSGWYGDLVEKDWTDAMLYFTLRKVSKYIALGFEKFDETWLLVYDQWPLPGVELERASEIFLSRLCELREQIPFTAIYIEHGTNILRFSVPHRFTASIRDVWRDKK